MTTKCSECGKILYISSPTTYKYRTSNPKYKPPNKSLNEKSVGSSSHYQCSYTCYDHSLLRSARERSSLTTSNYKNAVIHCEAAMRAQGKEILYPIFTKNIRKDDD